MQSIWINIATIGPVGRLPIAPGTWGSAVGVVIWWFLLAALEPLVFWTTVAFFTLIAIIASTRAEGSLGCDAHPIIIDEVVGQWIPLAICERRILLVALAFTLFRLFDIVKPFPVNVSQKLNGGLGVVADDLLAGGYTLVILVILNRLGFV